MQPKDVLKWVNNKKVIAPKADKPCLKLKFCPYGQVVEIYPLRMKKSKLSCPIFGHDCPVHYMMEKL